MEHGAGGVRGILADRGVGVVVLLAFVLMLGAGISFPILPLFARSFGGGYDSAGIFVAVYSFARLLADLGGGVVVDRVGERLAAAGGLAVVAVMTALTGLAPTYGLATAAYACSGIGSAVVFAAMYSQLLKMVPQERMARTLSVFYGAFNVGVVAGGLAAGVIADRLGLASPLFFTAGIAALGALVYLRLVPAAEGVTAPAGLRAARWRLSAVSFARPGSRMVLVTNFAYLWMIVAVFDTLLPLFADSLGMSTIGIGVDLRDLAGRRARRALPGRKPGRSARPAQVRPHPGARRARPHDHRRRVGRLAALARRRHGAARDRLGLRRRPTGGDALRRDAPRRVGDGGRHLSLRRRPRLHAGAARGRLRRRPPRLRGGVRAHGRYRTLLALVVVVRGQETLGSARTGLTAAAELA